MLVFQRCISKWWPSLKMTVKKNTQGFGKFSFYLKRKLEEIDVSDGS